jgi:hypothetical protein
MRKEIIDQIKNEKFVEKILNTETPEEVKKAFKENNIDISDAELKELGGDMYHALKGISELPDSKVSDKELEKISGGIVITATLVGTCVTVLGGVAVANTTYQTAKINAGAAKDRLKAAEIKSSWKGILANNPGFATMSAVGAGLSAALIAKSIISGIRDGSLKRWFEISDDPQEDDDE